MSEDNLVSSLGPQAHPRCEVGVPPLPLGLKGSLQRARAQLRTNLAVKTFVVELFLVVPKNETKEETSTFGRVAFYWEPYKQSVSPKDAQAVDFPYIWVHLMRARNKLDDDLEAWRVMDYRDAGHPPFVLGPTSGLNLKFGQSYANKCMFKKHAAIHTYPLVAVMLPGANTLKQCPMYRWLTYQATTACLCMEGVSLTKRIVFARELEVALTGGAALNQKDGDGVESDAVNG
eukprot:2703384-Amphidinium_carterae.1